MSRGGENMITIGRISDIDAQLYDENWLIVRSLKSLPAGAVHRPELSPSRSLFFKYLDVKKIGQFNEPWFQQVYVPTFLKELIQDRQNFLLLDQLYRDSFTKNILLACFCTDETLCHRSIVAGLLAGAGAQITCNPAYKTYYGMFTKLCA